MGHNGRPLCGTTVEDSLNPHRSLCNPRGLVRGHPACCPRPGHALLQTSPDGQASGGHEGFRPPALPHQGTLDPDRDASLRGFAALRHPAPRGRTIRVPRLGHRSTSRARASPCCPPVSVRAGDRRGSRHAAVGSASQLMVDFARDIQPLLAQHCLRCRGPTKQDGDLRLDSSRSGRKGEGTRAGAS